MYNSIIMKSLFSKIFLNHNYFKSKELISMARKPRANVISSFIHVMMQGINKEYIFESDRHKTKYMYLLFEKMVNYDIELLSYCVMDNHIHCLFHYRNINHITKLMQGVNSTYAKWYNYRKGRVGYVFRDRYKIEEIQSLHHLYSCIRYIHNNPVKAGIVSKPGEYKYSSYNEYARHEGICNAKLISIMHLTWKDIDNIFINDENKLLEDYYETDTNKKIDDFINKNGLKLLNNQKDKKMLILFLKNSCNYSCFEIAKVLKISRTTIYRILKK